MILLLHPNSKIIPMAEITVSTNKKHRQHKVPRVDLTPLVDLGFLLITFFIFTTTLSNPTAMSTLLPAESTDSTQVAASGAVSLIADANYLHYYVGQHPQNVEKLPYNDPGLLRQKLIALQQSLIAREGNDDKLFVLIKPANEASFGAVVSLLDEMKICGIKRYTLADLNELERNINSHPE
jgi:biopolymer transport protein ExbD